VISLPLILAALGGLVLGLGAGLVIGRRRERRIAQRLVRVETRLRTSVLPMLERRASSVGVRREQRAIASDETIDVVSDLADSIRRYEDNPQMAYSDTLDVARESLKAPAANK